MVLYISPAYPHIFMVQCFIRQGSNFAFTFWFCWFLRTSAIYETCYVRCDLADVNLRQYLDLRLCSCKI